MLTEATQKSQSLSSQQWPGPKVAANHWCRFIVVYTNAVKDSVSLSHCNTVMVQLKCHQSPLSAHHLSLLSSCQLPLSNNARLTSCLYCSSSSRLRAAILRDFWVVCSCHTCAAKNLCFLVTRAFCCWDRVADSSCPSLLLRHRRSVRAAFASNSVNSPSATEPPLPG